MGSLQLDAQQTSTPTKFECKGNGLTLPAIMESQSSLPRLLSLPLEIRHQIYTYVLPRTVQHPSGTRIDAGIVWLRGQTAIMATCQQLNTECMALVYGRNTFVISVGYDRIHFRFRWLLPANQNLSPSRTFSFLDHFSQRTIQLIKNYRIDVEQVDPYTGMIKFNCQGRGLTDGLRSQVSTLVETLRAAGELHRVDIRFGGPESSLLSREISRLQLGTRAQKPDPEQAETVLVPFILLKQVRNASVVGNVYADSAEYLTKKMREDPNIVSKAPSMKPVTHKLPISTKSN